MSSWSVHETAKHSVKLRRANAKEATRALQVLWGLYYRFLLRANEDDILCLATKVPLPCATAMEIIYLWEDQESAIVDDDLESQFLTEYCELSDDGSSVDDDSTWFPDEENSIELDDGQIQLSSHITSTDQNDNENAVIKPCCGFADLLPHYSPARAAEVMPCLVPPLNLYSDQLVPSLDRLRVNISRIEKFRYALGKGIQEVKARRKQRSRLRRRSMLLSARDAASPRRQSTLRQVTGVEDADATTDDWTAVAPSQSVFGSYFAQSAQPTPSSIEW